MVSGLVGWLSVGRWSVVLKELVVALSFHLCLCRNVD